MKKTLTFAALAATALTLVACKGETAEAPAAEPTAEATEAMPADDAALDDAAAAADGTTTNSNPVPPAAGEAPAEAAPAAE